MWIFWTILLTTIGTGLMQYGFHKDYNLKGLCGFMSSFILLIAVSILGYNISEPKPTAMDVYQGKTTLEYKVLDGEIVDSCVVWKSK